MQYTDTPRLLNPWKSIWLQPRQTIRQLVDTDPTYNVIKIVLIVGILNGIGSVDAAFSVKPVYGILLALGMALVSGLAGLIFLYIGGWLQSWTGSWIGGQARPLTVRTAIAWSQVPVLWGSAAYAIVSIVVFSSLTPESGATEDEIYSSMLSQIPLLILFVLATMAQFTLSIWALVVQLIGLSEVQGFSVWKALGNMLLAGLVAVCFILVITMIIMIPVVLLA